MEVALYVYSAAETFMDAAVCQVSIIIREYFTRAKITGSTSEKNG